MSDTIYRQDAINTVKEYWKAEVDAIPKNVDFGTLTDTCNMILKHNAEICKALDCLPPAQQQRKTGKWITVNSRLGNEVECDKCHSVFWYWMGNYKFCPSCGARMDGENE